MSSANPAMKKYLVKSKLGIGRDFSVYDDEEATHKVFFIDAKMGLGTKAEIKNMQGEVLYTAKGKIFNIPKRMEFFAPDGTVAATIKAHFSPLKSKMTIAFADTTEWLLEGNIIEKNYEIHVGARLVLKVDQKWLTVRDKYFVQIADDVNLPLALGFIWAVDIWREAKNN